MEEKNKPDFKAIGKQAAQKLEESSFISKADEAAKTLKEITEFAHTVEKAVKRSPFWVKVLGGAAIAGAAWFVLTKKEN